MRVLLVEDSPDDRFWLSRLLRDSTSDIEVTAVGTAERALELALAETFDVIVTDHNLPGQTGVEFLAALRREKNWTPVMVVTGSGDISAAQGSVDAGAAAFLAKDALDEDALRRGIERSLGVSFLPIDLAALAMSPSDTAKRLVDRLSVPMAALDSDMRAIRERPSSRVADDEQAALDELEGKILAVQHKIRDALQAYQMRSELY
ncbi:MAG: response regulator [Litorivicinus sp.]